MASAPARTRLQLLVRGWVRSGTRDVITALGGWAAGRTRYASRDPVRTAILRERPRHTRDTLRTYVTIVPHVTRDDLMRLERRSLVVKLWLTGQHTYIQRRGGNSLIKNCRIRLPTSRTYEAPWGAAAAAPCTPQARRGPMTSHQQRRQWAAGRTGPHHAEAPSS